MLSGTLKRAAQGLSPASFALVMATGIVAIDGNLLGIPGLAAALLGLNVVAYLATAALTVFRGFWFPRDLLSDLSDHERGPGFYTSVAASAVLGRQFVLAHHYAIATLLWIVSLALWIGLTYGMLFAFIVKERKPTLDDAVSGAWLLVVVATQSIAVLSADLAARAELTYGQELWFLALSMWLCGAMLYVWVISLVFYRCIFLRFAPADFAPTYWISMGAMAISTLAGSLLILGARGAPLLASLAPFIRGFTVLCWATGTWWIPMMVALVFWRYLHAGHPLRYEPLQWGAVFPLGMYASCTFEMAHALSLEFLYPTLPALSYVALVAWAVAFGGLVRALSRPFLLHRHGSA